MKATIAVLMLTMSITSHAISLGDSTVITGASPYLSSATTTGPLPEKQAEIILNDSQEFFQTGKLSSFLAQKIMEVQAVDQSASEQDAVDILVGVAEKILNK